MRTLLALLAIPAAILIFAVFYTNHQCDRTTITKIDAMGVKYQECTKMNRTRIIRVLD